MSEAFRPFFEGIESMGIHVKRGLEILMETGTWMSRWKLGSNG